MANVMWPWSQKKGERRRCSKNLINRAKETFVKGVAEGRGSRNWINWKKTAPRRKRKGNSTINSEKEQTGRESERGDPQPKGQ